MYYSSPYVREYLPIHNARRLSEPLKSNIETSLPYKKFEKYDKNI